MWSSNHFSTPSRFPRFSGSRFLRVHVFLGPGFLGSRFFRVQVFQGPSFSKSRFFRVQVFLGPGFSGSRIFKVQVLEVALLFEEKRILKINVYVMNLKAARYWTLQFINIYMIFIKVNSFYLSNSLGARDGLLNPFFTKGLTASVCKLDKMR